MSKVKKVETVTSLKKEIKRLNEELICSLDRENNLLDIHQRVESKIEEIEEAGKINKRTFLKAASKNKALQKNIEEQARVCAILANQRSGALDRLAKAEARIQILEENTLRAEGPSSNSGIKVTGELDDKTTEGLNAFLQGIMGKAMKKDCEDAEKCPVSDECDEENTCK